MSKMPAARSLSRLRASRSICSRVLRTKASDDSEEIMFDDKSLCEMRDMHADANIQTAPEAIPEETSHCH